jgi:hypothetical protein
MNRSMTNDSVALDAAIELLVRAHREGDDACEAIAAAAIAMIEARSLAPSNTTEHAGGAS